MRKRKIDQAYLRSILSPEVRDDEIDALSFALTLKDFTDEYLKGIATCEVAGSANGKVSLKLSVVSYLVRLLAESADEGDTVRFSITLDENMLLAAHLRKLPDVAGTAHIVKVARLAGFDVERECESLYFKAKIRVSSIMQIYATSSEEFMHQLIITFKM